MEVKPWLLSFDRRKLLNTATRLLGDDEEIEVKYSKNELLDTYIHHLGQILPVSKVRITRLRAGSPRTFVEGYAIYLPLGPGRANNLMFESGNLIVARESRSITFETSRTVILLTFLSTGFDILPPEVLTQIGSNLTNEDLRSLINTSRATTYIDPPDRERRLRRCGVYGKSIDYWETFLKQELPFIECYKYFLDKGADVNSVVSYISSLVEKGYVDLVIYLISRGADFFNSDEIMINTVKFGHIEIIKYLVDVGKTFDIDSVLGDAAQYGQLEISKYLVSLGADPSTDDYFPLALAISYGHLDVVKYFVSVNRPPDINLLEGYGRKDPIGAVVTSGNMEMLEYLISLGATVKHYYLNTAASRGDLDMLKYLFSQNGYKDKFQAMVGAVYGGQLDTVKYLVSIGSRPNEHLLDMSLRDREMAEFFFEQGFFNDLKQETKNRFFEISIGRGNIKLMRGLRSIGGKWYHDRTCPTKHLDALKELFSLMEFNNIEALGDMLIDAIEREPMDIVVYLVEYIGKINPKFLREKLPIGLVKSISKSNKVMTDYLLSLKATITWNALTQATLVNDMILLKRLISLIDSGHNSSQ